MLAAVFGGLFGLLLPVLLIVGVVYLVRSKGSHEGPTIYDALAAYFYTIIGASMITTAVGCNPLHQCGAGELGVARLRAGLS